MSKQLGTNLGDDSLGERTERTVEIAEIWRVLSDPPYGYNEYTFTILFAGWLTHHRLEVLLMASAFSEEIRSGFGAY